MKPILKTSIILDDHRLFADSFSALMERIGLFQSVHTFYEESELIRFMVSHPNIPFYLFLDYYFQNKTGLNLINETRRLNKQSKVIITSSVVKSSTISNILSYSPDAFISKLSGFDVILQCLQTIDNNEEYFCPVISKIVANSTPAENVLFTNRELEILQLFSEGASIAQAADMINLSKHTIVSHRRNMMKKAKVNSITQLLAYARAHDLM